MAKSGGGFLLVAFWFSGGGFLVFRRWLFGFQVVAFWPGQCTVRNILIFTPDPHVGANYSLLGSAEAETMRYSLG